jgi:hypothetical protein
MAVSVSSGIVDTELLVADEKVVDMKESFILLDSDTSQFMTMLSKLPSRAAKREKINWLEDQYFPNLSALASGSISLSTQTVIDVTAGEGLYFRANDIVLVAMTGEKMSVTSLTTDAITFVRGVGDVAAATATSGTELVILGNAASQGADTGTLKQTKRVLGYNYSQIFRNPFGFTGTDAAIETYGPGDPENEIAKKAVEHKRGLENSVWFGGRDFSSVANASKGYMGGITEFVTTNVSNSIGALTLSGLDSRIQSAMQYGSLNKVIFAAPGPAAALSRLLANNWVQASPSDRVYGAKVNSFINGAYGEALPVIVKRDWGRFAAASNQLGGKIFVLDLDYIEKRPLRGRDTHLRRDQQGNGVDSVVFDYLTEMSLEVGNEKAHAILSGITS